MPRMVHGGPSVGTDRVDSPVGNADSRPDSWYIVGKVIADFRDVSTNNKP